MDQKKGYSTAATLKEILSEISDFDWLVASAVIRRDGALLASNMSQSMEIKDVCALMSATIVGAAKNITTKCHMGFPRRVIIQAKEGSIIISDAGSKALLVCQAKASYEPFLIFDDIEKAAKKIEAIL